MPTSRQHGQSAKALWTKRARYIVLILFGIAIPAFFIKTTSTDSGYQFWESFYIGYVSQLPELILRSVAPMLPPVLFAILLALLLGWITGRGIIGRRLIPRIVMLSAMFGMYGILIGYILGASSQSIAKELLASIVTIVSGLFGYFISKDLPDNLKAMIPPVILCFLISVLFSSHYYSNVREARELIYAPQAPSVPSENSSYRPVDKVGSDKAP